MDFKRYKNRYIALADTLPSFLLSASERCLSAEQASVIDSRLAQSNQIFFDLGSGSGGFTINLAQNFPEACVVGVELRFKRAYRSAEKSKAAGISNLFFVRTDITDFLKYIRPNSVDGCFVNFPDPWSKERWKKHRIMNPIFLQTVAQILKPDGFLSYRTDHEEYFQETVKLLDTLKIFRREDRPPALIALDAGDGESEFGKLFKSKNQHVNNLFVKRI